jgi:poly(A) polymerase
VESLSDLGLLRHVLPEVEALRGVEQPEEFHPEGDVLEHTLAMLDLAEDPSETLALGILLHDSGKPPTFEKTDRIRFNRHAKEGARMAGAAARRLRLSNERVERVTALVRDHMKFIEIRRMRPSTLKRFLRADGFDEHLELHRLDCLSSHGKLDHWTFAREKLDEFGEEGLRPPRLVSGRDLMDLHIPRGPLYKRILDAVEEEQLAGRLGSREEALEWAKAYWEAEKGRR